jgi:hypothetical protein
MHEIRCRWLHDGATKRLKEVDSIPIKHVVLAVHNPITQKYSKLS